MSGDMEEYLDNITSTFPSTELVATPRQHHPPAPEVMMPFGFIAVALALCLGLMGIRNLRRDGTHTSQKELVEQLHDDPDGDEDRFLNDKRV